MNVLEIVQNLIFESEIVTNKDYETTCFCIKPTRLDDLPIIDASKINNEYLKVVDKEDIISYFNYFIDTEEPLRIDNIDCIPLNNEVNGYYCDYCNTRITDNWFFCYHCYKDMCKRCYEETAVKNETINYCKSTNKVIPRNLHNLPVMSKYCDVCSERIKTDIYYTDKLDSGTEYIDTYDICNTCYENNKNDAVNIITEQNMIKIDKTDKKFYAFNYCNMNSMLYWIPVISSAHEPKCYVLINLNPDDVNYKKICLSSADNHCRQGYFIVRDDNYTLDKIVDELKDITDRGKYDYVTKKCVKRGVYETVTETDTVETDSDDGVEITEEVCIEEPVFEDVIETSSICESAESHVSPIQLLMRKFKMKVYYG